MRSTLVLTIDADSDGTSPVVALKRSIANCLSSIGWVSTGSTDTTGSGHFSGGAETTAATAGGFDSTCGICLLMSFLSLLKGEAKGLRISQKEDRREHDASRLCAWKGIVVKLLDAQSKPRDDAHGTVTSSLQN